MNLTQFLIFEVCSECNLGTTHGRCPNRHPERCKCCDKETPLPDEKIIEIAEAAHTQHRFRGLIGFHFYNEPLCAKSRMLSLIPRIKEKIPEQRFVLWTNGTLLPPEGAELESLRVFDRCWLTKYDAKDYSRIKKVIPHTTILQWKLDNRASQRLPKDNFGPCGRMFSELIIDYWGNAHICCIDWKGEVKLGNVQDEPFSDILGRFQSIRRDVSSLPMKTSAPLVCKRCHSRHANISDLEPVIAETARQQVGLHRQEDEVLKLAEVQEKRKALHRERGLESAPPFFRLPGVVFVSYRIPEPRLRDHFRWNNPFYVEKGVRVFIVVDRKVNGLPEYVRQLEYPEEMKVFNLSATKNYGIRVAVESGCSPLIVTDVDLHFSDASWRLCRDVPPGKAVVPIYRMAANLEHRQTLFVLAPKATGTVAMRAEHWRMAHYNEACVGYGGDDAVVLMNIAKAGIKVDRIEGAEAWHIAHQPDTPQREFDPKNPRIDHWNRQDGFNPCNFRANRLNYRKPKMEGEQWGLLGSDLTLVLTHYRMPSRRLSDFIEWNQKEIERIGARVIVVDDEDHRDIPLPEWVRVAIYPIPLEIFNLSATSNYGIRLAAQGIVCKTDPDVFFSPDAMSALLTVTPEKGICFQYRMSVSASPEDIAKAQVWDASKGTVAMTYDHWCASFGYDERMEGYGIEDGDLFYRAGKVEGRRCVRVPERLWHIAHTSAHQSLTRRPDYWNRTARREEAFNPLNHRANQNVRRLPWADPSWGIPSSSSSLAEVGAGAGAVSLEAPEA